MKAAKRDFQPDLVRASMILLVFLGHAIPLISPQGSLSVFLSALSPGMTMSLLGFLSAKLLSDQKKNAGEASFLIKRGLRIFVPLWSSMTLIILSTALINGWQMSISTTHPHTLLHLMGLSAFGDMFGVQNQSMIGSGLWFITVIFGLYLFLPVLNLLMRHKNATAHLMVIIFVSAVCHIWIYESESFWNVVIGFSLGVYYRNCKASQHRYNPDSEWFNAWQTTTGVALFFTLIMILFLITSGYWQVDRGVRDVFFPLYPIVCMPMFSWISTWGLWRPALQRAVCYFSMISFEFYLVHFYFINGHWWSGNSPTGVGVGFIASLGVASVLFHINKQISGRLEGYMFKH